MRVVGDVEAHSVDNTRCHIKPEVTLGADVLVFLACRIGIETPIVEDVLVSYNQLERFQL